jgi:hypothetical protein
MAEERKMTADEAAKYYRAKLLELKFQEEQKKTRGLPSEIDTPEHATSFLKLAAALNVARTTLYRLKDRPDAPKMRDDKTYDIEEWRAYLETALETNEDAHDEEMQKLKRENLRLVNANRRFELLKKQGGLLTMEEHLAEIRELIDQVKWLIGTIPTRAALLTTDEGVRRSISGLCAHLADEFRARLFAAEEKAAVAERAVKEIEEKQQDGEEE